MNHDLRNLTYRYLSKPRTTRISILRDLGVIEADAYGDREMDVLGLARIRNRDLVDEFARRVLDD